MITGEFPDSLDAIHLAVVQHRVHPTLAHIPAPAVGLLDDEEAKLVAYYGGDLGAILGHFWD